MISWAGQCEDIAPEKTDPRIACGNAVGILPITWDGKAALCVMDVNADYECGDVNINTIKEIWQKRNEAFVKKHMEHRFDELPAICQKCTDWEIIGEKRFDENGNEVGKNYEEREQMLGENG